MIYDGIISKPPLDDVLAHHGILGQKWGKRNGPPYPLAANKHSAAEKKAGYQKSIDKKSNDTKDGFYIPVSLSLYAVTTLTMLGISAGQSIKSKSAMRSINKKIEKSPKDPKTGLALKQQEYTEKQDLKNVNPGYNSGDVGYRNNCASCTMTYELRRRGYEVTANKNPAGISRSDYAKYFDIKPAKSIGNRKTSGGTGGLMVWANETKQQHKEYAASVIKDLNKLPKGTRGNLSVSWGQGGGHSMFFEIGNKGVIVRDGQINKVYDNEKQLTNLFSNVIETSYFRLDNAKLKPKYIKEVCH